MRWVWRMRSKTSHESSRKSGWCWMMQRGEALRMRASSSGSKTSKNGTNLSQLQLLLEEIRNKLSEKRFLLVLDDVWTENDAEWAPFKNCLKVAGLPGSKILVTSRSERVATMMGSVYLHRVELISDSDAWLLLSRIALSGRREQDYEKLKEIGQKIAQKCKGLPLAVKVMGSLLHCKDKEEWQYVLSQLDTKFSNVEGVETHLFPHLYLSYDDLTPQMKRCFSYCAIFPKDYKIQVDELIKIWMAQGYLTTTKGRSDQNQMEQKGWEVFNNLEMRSLFQDLTHYIYYNDSNFLTCKMHDIVHDFVEFLTKNECYSINQHEDKVKLENHRHLSWQKIGKPLDLASIGKLRSFFAKDLSSGQFTSDLFNGMKSLRVLGLQGCELQKLPDEIGNLLHLKYIDLSKSRIEELPDSICTLDNLQSLNLEGCECLSRLPGEIGNLHYLRYIDLSGSRVEELPDSICSLDNLKTLNLSGSNCLSRLPEGIENLHHLRYIGLSRSRVEELPNSICFLENLKTLNLRDCRCLSRLPEGIGNLSQLRRIDLSMSKVEELPDSICFLENLQYLNLRHSVRLSRLPKEIGNLSQLRWIDLSMSKVEELPDSICSLENLNFLNLRGCECLSRLPEGIENLHKILFMDSRGSTVEEFPNSNLHNILSLENLETLSFGRGCECLSKLPAEIENLPKLRLIHLRGSKVEELPDSIYSLNNLEIRHHLKIGKLGNL